MAQIYLGKDPKSLAVGLIAKYTRAVDSELVTLVEVTPEQQKALNIASVPCLLATEGERTFKCSAPFAIFRHIAEATRFEKIFLGRNEAENSQILSYFELVSNLEQEELAQLLNNDLKLRMFLVGFNITAADIFAYTHVVDYVKNLQDFEKLDQSNLFRWVDHIQHLPSIKEFAAKNLLEVSFPNEDAKQPSKSELKKMAKKQALQDKKANKKEKGENKKQETQQAKAPEEEEKKNADAQDTPDAKHQKKDKKQKQQNPPKNKGGKQPEDDDVENIAKLDIRVGQITKVWRHPDSTKLYCEEVNIGENQPRQIASGLQEYVQIERMENAMVLVLANLKARKLAGFESHGMVLCAETPDKSAVELLVPPDGSKPGDVVSIKGFEMKPPNQLNPKKKIFESVVGDLRVDENGVAKYKDAEFVTENGVVVAEAIRNGIIA